MTGRPPTTALALLAAAVLALAWPATAPAATLAEIFLQLPSDECGGYNVAQRQDLLGKITAAPNEQGPASAPDDALSPRLRQPSPNLLILQRPLSEAITYKLFEGRSFQLLVICRGRNRPTPGDPVTPLDLGLYRFDRVGLNRANLYDYLPDIGILDFVTADTVTDLQAVRTLARLAPTYSECLSCSLSLTHRLTLDIITATAFNAAACNDLLPTFGRLPLTWDGQAFTKPYDRAAPRDPADARP
ncbi:MAG: hypothetical protein LBV21_05615 [Candidatus Adiutrix sp.]|jgi:hypothetical protein|nr:hypothetical protein [Candidatus Adiutrix sp.]